MQELKEISAVRGNGRNGSGPPPPSSPFLEDTNPEEQITCVEAALGIRIFEDRIVPTEEGIEVAANENHITLLSRGKLKSLESVWHLATGAVGALYGFVLGRIFDAQSPFELATLFLVGMSFAMAASTIIARVWSHQVSNSYESGDAKAGLMNAIATTILIALIDLATQGYIVHRLLTEDLFGLPSDTLTVVASFGVSLMSTAVLVLLAKIAGTEDALYQVSRTLVIGRALTFYHPEVSASMILRKRLREVRSNEFLTRHKPQISRLTEGGVS